MCKHQINNEIALQDNWKALIFSDLHRLSKEEMLVVCEVQLS